MKTEKDYTSFEETVAHGSEKERERGIDILTKINDYSAIYIILKYFHFFSDDTKQYAKNKVEKYFENNKAQLKKTLKNTSGRIRENALDILSDTKSDDIIEIILNNIDDIRTNVNKKVINLLIKHLRKIVLKDNKDLDKNQYITNKDISVSLRNILKQKNVKISPYLIKLIISIGDEMNYLFWYLVRELDERRRKIFLYYFYKTSIKKVKELLFIGIKTPFELSREAALLYFEDKEKEDISYFFGYVNKQSVKDANTIFKIMANHKEFMELIDRLDLKREFNDYYTKGEKIKDIVNIIKTSDNKNKLKTLHKIESLRPMTLNPIIIAINDDILNQHDLELKKKYLCLLKNTNVEVLEKVSRSFLSEEKDNIIKFLDSYLSKVNKVNMDIMFDFFLLCNVEISTFLYKSITKNNNANGSIEQAFIDNVKKVSDKNKLKHIIWLIGETGESKYLRVLDNIDNKNDLENDIKIAKEKIKVLQNHR